MKENSSKKYFVKDLFRFLVTKLCFVLLIFEQNHRLRFHRVSITFCSGLLIFILFFAFFLSGCSQTTVTSQDPSAVPSEADIEFQKGAGRPPTVKTFYSMAEILAIQGKDSECEFVLKRCIYDYPNFLPAYHSLAELQMRQSRTGDAIVTLNSALKISPRDTITLNNLGMCCFFRKDYHLALKFFTDAAGILPYRTKYRSNMALALALLGRDEESLSLYTQILPQADAEKNLQIIRVARQTLTSQSEPNKPAE